jgi:hypothetical protein
VEPARQVLAKAADPDVAREEPEPRNTLVDVQQELALAKAVKHHGHRAELHCVRAEPDQMAVDPLELGQEHANPFHAIGHFEAEKLLHRQAVRVGIGLRAEVVHPLDERNHLLKFLLLGGLFDAGVQVSDRRCRRHDRLTIELEHQPEHSVSAGVLRPHIDGHRFRAELGHL